MVAHSNVAPVVIKRKKVVAHGGHHGGAWKVAYADFVTAMMAFFMLMWLLNATTEQQRKGLADYFSPTIPINRVSGGGSGAFSGDSIFSEQSLPKTGTGATQHHPATEREARGDSGTDVNGELGAAQDPALESLADRLLGRGGESDIMENKLRHVVTRLTDEALVVEIFENEDARLFNGDSDIPTWLLRDIAVMIAEAAEMVTNGIALEGHVRAHPVVLANNPVWEMSMARADVLRALLQDAGLPADRIHRVTGHADREPASIDPMALRNNRLEIVFLRSDA